MVANGTNGIGQRNGTPIPLRRPTARRDVLQTQLTALAYQVLCRLHRADWPDETLLTFANDHRFACRIVIGPSGSMERPNNGPVNIVTPPMFPPMELDILRVMSAEPQTAKKLARLADRQHNSHFRQAVSDLCRKGLIVRVPDGYRWA